MQDKPYTINTGQIDSNGTLDFQYGNVSVLGC